MGPGAVQAGRPGNRSSFDFARLKRTKPNSALSPVFFGVTYAVKPLGFTLISPGFRPTFADCFGKVVRKKPGLPGPLKDFPANRL